MGFQLKGWRTTGAWGLLNRPEAEVGENLRKALCRAKDLVLQQAQPVSRKKFPLDRLRKRFAHIMSLDVIFSPRLTSRFENDKYPNSRIPVRKVWEISPVWKCAPRGAEIKANKLCSLLHSIATDGWKANIVHDLVRLAINPWQMPMRHFNGLCRRILSRIHKSTSSLRGKDHPDPAVRFSALTANPIGNAYRVSRLEKRKRRRIRLRNGHQDLPIDLGLQVHLLGTEWYFAHTRVIGLRQTT
jgi:hypothetical protein